MIEYVVTTHRHVSGAYLSRTGQWGNMPHTSADAAKRAAHEDAKGQPYTITRKGS